MASENSRTSRSSRIKVGITVGDPCGIGPEIAFKALKESGRLADFLVIGDEWVLNRSSGFRFARTGAKVMDLDNVPRNNFRFGRARPEYGRAAVEYLDRALELLGEGKIDCLVTLPVSKESINKAGIDFPGHTEYLARRTGTGRFEMMLLNRHLKFCLVTRHVSLKEAASKLTTNRIIETVSLAHRSLKTLFSLKDPRIAVCGLNPHASDNGLMGREEELIIGPALNACKKKIKYLCGPLAADVAISKARQGLFDCVIAMYHDQALIPLKITGRESGVNLTLGLPFVRTSPLHGTAFDIAGLGVADPASAIEAIKLAIRCTRNLKKD